MTAREYMADIEKWYIKIQTIKAELNACYASINLLPGVSFDGVHVQTSTNDSKALELVEEATDKYHQLLDKVAEYERKREAAFEVVMGLENKAHIEVLYLRYFSWMAWDRIAEKMGFKRDTKRAHQIHREALEELEKVIGGQDDSNKKRMDNHRNAGGDPGADRDVGK